MRKAGQNDVCVEVFIREKQEPRPAPLLNSDTRDLKFEAVASTWALSGRCAPTRR
jgi:hypothetical protein